MIGETHLVRLEPLEISAPSLVLLQALKFIAKICNPIPQKPKGQFLGTPPMKGFRSCVISARTKATLAAAKGCGIKLGGQRGNLGRMKNMSQKGDAARAAVRSAAAAKCDEISCRSAKLNRPKSAPRGHSDQRRPKTHGRRPR